MASWSDFEGKTVDAALQKASRKTGVSIDKLKYEIVFAGSSGIFGLVGAKNARIRVQNGAGGQQSEQSDQDREDIQSLLDETFLEKTAPEKGSKNQPEPKRVPPAPRRSRSVSQEVDEATVQLGKETLQKIVNVISEGSTITSEPRAGTVLFNIEGGSAGVLIGKHGQTLKAMQHIVEKVMHKAHGEKVRVQVDVEKYMEKRKANLTSLASKLAEKAKQSGKPAIINRMDSFERKIIHDALRKDKEVKTRSTGGGDVRNVVIHPGKPKAPRKAAPESSPEGSPENSPERSPETAPDKQPDKQPDSQADQPTGSPAADQQPDK